MNISVMAVSLLAIAPLSANAAEIKYQGDEDGFHYISVVGELVDGDAARFGQMAIRWSDKSPCYRK